MGVRPEDVRLGGAGTGIPATVELAEPLGSELLLHVRTGGIELTARLPAIVPPASGSAVHLAVDPARLHFFDPGSGLAIGDPRVPPGGRAPEPGRPDNFTGAS
jgi:multiple sugar transport system ATP-binding protein